MISKTDTIDVDELLIERIKAGDMAAYNAMVIRHYDRIFSRVLQLLNNKQDAEEVTQDAFIRAHRGREFPRRCFLFHLALPDRYQSGAQPLLVLVSPQA